MNIFMKLLQGMADMIINMLMGFLSFPIFPPEVAQAFDYVLQWLTAGLGILNFFCPLSAIAPGLTFVIIIYAIDKAYHFIMWVIRKLPFLGIE